MDCPKCLGKLQEREIISEASSAVPELSAASATFELQVDQCFVCGGVWFDKGELDKYITEQLTAVNESDMGRSVVKELDRKKGDCPKCHILMQQIPAPQLPQMTIDVCGKCQGVWLDATEIDRLEHSQKPKAGFWELVARGLRRHQPEE